MLAIFASIESGGDPTNRTGSYKGLFQLSDSEFEKWGYGNIWNANDNARAAAAKLRAEADDFRGTYGREPTPVDIYMQHQQGVAGYAAHMSNPDTPAWENMWSTGEGRSKGADWAKRAIWGNVPTRFKRMFGDVESITSREFVDMWDQVIKTKGRIGEFRDAVDISEDTPDSLPTPKPSGSPSGVSKFLDNNVYPTDPTIATEVQDLGKKWNDVGEESKNIEDRRTAFQIPLDEVDQMLLNPEKLTPYQQAKIDEMLSKDYIKVLPKENVDALVKQMTDDFVKWNKIEAASYAQKRQKEIDYETMKEAEKQRKEKQLQDILGELDQDPNEPGISEDERYTRKYIKEKLDAVREARANQLSDENASIDRRIGPILSDLIEGKITEYPDALGDLLKEIQDEIAREDKSTGKLPPLPKLDKQHPIPKPKPKRK